ncbi:MAG: hypothetical protein UR98_C0003G0021 [Parcubacteria group bacterium GW2011_GWA1_36_12]|nr:MAG: hypothetical protein UR98_C0003G0021 [Parcubacteria group bacterium GW2011_GWA1_36_12]
MYFVYILKSLKDNKHYIGFTKNIDARLTRHNSDNVTSTRHRRPLKLIYKEHCGTYSEARKREIEIKKMKGGIQFKELLKNAGVAQW